MIHIEKFAPLLFVSIWATGVVVSRWVAPHTEPLTFLSFRYILSALGFALLARRAGALWPHGYQAWRDAAISGTLLHAVYLGAVFWSIDRGLPAGIVALILGLQPLLTALLAYPLLGERVYRRQWAGIWVGFFGALLVLLPQVIGNQAIGTGPLIAAFIALLSITLGTLWQKYSVKPSDLRSNAAVQFLVAAMLTAPLALLTEQGQFDWAFPAVAGLIWGVLGLSLGAVSLLLYLIQRGSVTGVSSLFYLVPPVVALLAYALFDEQLNGLQVLGMAVTAVGVAVASRATR